MSRDCGKCRKPIDGFMISCITCNAQFHRACVKVDLNDTNAQYFCETCHRKEKDKCFKCKKDLADVAMMWRYVYHWYHYKCEDIDETTKDTVFVCSCCVVKGYDKCAKCKGTFTDRDEITLCGGYFIPYHDLCAVEGTNKTIETFVCDPCEMRN
jgi:PHD-finger